MKKLVFTFGRMNPPTIGHEKLANKIKEVARKENANPDLSLSHTESQEGPTLIQRQIPFCEEGLRHRPTIPIETNLSDITRNRKRRIHRHHHG